MLFETSLNTVIYIRATHLEFQYKDRVSYQNYQEDIGPIIQQLKAVDQEFFRIEKTFFRSYNDALNQDYAAITHYSSSINRPMLNFLKNVGFIQALYRMRYTGQTLPMDSILGIKYLLSEEPLHADYVEIQQSPVDTEFIPGGRVFTYENPYALPLGFMVQPELAELHLDRYNPLYWQDRILCAMTGCRNGRFFHPVVVEAVETVNITLGETQDGWLRYAKQNPEMEAVIEYHLLVQDDGPVYGFLVAQDQSKMEVTIGDHLLGYIGENSENNQVLLLGDFKAGSRITVKARLLWEGATLLNDSLFYQLNMEHFRQAHQDLTANSLKVSAFSDTTVDAKVSAASEKSLLFTSIPYDPSWAVFLDGQSVETIPLMDAFLGIQVPPGDHEVRFEYHPRGWLAGWAITGSTLALAGMFYWLRRRRN